jgi:hypothetical protein
VEEIVSSMALLASSFALSPSNTRGGSYVLQYAQNQIAAKQMHASQQLAYSPKDEFNMYPTYDHD